MKIKVCGLKPSFNNNEIAEMNGVDMLGFIFYSGSKRFTTESIPSIGKERIGVFVNATQSEILNTVREHQLTAVQLHGNESPEFCRSLRSYVQIIKAFGIETADDFNQIKTYEKVVDLLLFDTKSSQHGGTGISFDWRVIQDYTGSLPFLISGGIGLHSIMELKKIKHPKCIGIDINSCFEIEAGEKNPTYVKAFIESIKDYTS